MPSIIDYMLKTDAALAKNRAADSHTNLMPLQTVISALNTKNNAAKISQSQSRFNTPSYKLFRAISLLPSTARDHLFTDSRYASLANSLINQYGEQAVKEAVGQSQSSNGGAPNSSGNGQPVNVANGNIPGADNKAVNLITSGAQNEYDKKTHTGTQINRSIAGKNLETTLSQIHSLYPSIAKFAGNNGSLLKRGDPELAAMGIQNEDYDNYNTFMKSLLPQTTGQMTMFYGSSIQPSEVQAKAQQFAPHRGENGKEYMHRVSEVERNIRAELGQSQQDYNTNLHTPAVSLASNNQSDDNNDNPDFLSMLKARGIK